MEAISRYGIILRPLTFQKLELVRHWRNHPKISRYMAYREYITPDMQQKWFQRISASGCDFYFIIEYQGREIGLINVKDVDYQQKCGEQGIFVWDDEYLNSGVAFLAFFALDDFCMETLGLETVCCHILRDNRRAIRFDEYLGFRLCDRHDMSVSPKYQRTLGDKSIRAKILKFFGVE